MFGAVVSIAIGGVAQGDDLGFDGVRKGLGVTSEAEKVETEVTCNAKILQ